MELILTFLQHPSSPSLLSNIRIIITEVKLTVARQSGSRRGYCTYYMYVLECSRVHVVHVHTLSTTAYNCIIRTRRRGQHAAHPSFGDGKGPMMNRNQDPASQCCRSVFSPLHIVMLCLWMQFTRRADPERSPCQSTPSLQTPLSRLAPGILQTPQ